MACAHPELLPCPELHDTEHLSCILHRTGESRSFAWACADGKELPDRPLYISLATLQTYGLAPLAQPQHIKALIGAWTLRSYACMLTHACAAREA